MRGERASRKPVVLMTSGARTYSNIEYQLLAKKYMDSIIEFSHCIPLVCPTAYGTEDLDQYLDMADGLYVSGASTNIDPSHYGQEWRTPDLPQDKGRDIADFYLIKRALERGIPVLGVCRGFQEMNIVLGGDLHQAVHDVPGKLDHREKYTDGDDTSTDVLYGPAHPVQLVEGGMLGDLLGKSEITVNSLHGQALNRLGEGVKPVGFAPDGVVEAFVCERYPQFTLAVQWHPEWKTGKNPDSIRIFRAFGEACRKFADGVTTRAGA